MKTILNGLAGWLIVSGFLIHVADVYVSFRDVNRNIVRDLIIALMFY